MPALRSQRAAADFIDRAGFCFLFHQSGLRLDSLWAEVKGPVALTAEAWDQDAERLWTWKDRLPLQGRAAYGKYLRRKPTFIGARLLPAFLASQGHGGDYLGLYEDGGLSVLAREVASWVEHHGATPVSVLRRRLGGPGRVNRALQELQSVLLLTHYGVAQQRSGWPATVIELLGRAFPAALQEGREMDPEEGRARILAGYRARQPDAEARDAARVLGWRLDEVRAAW
ncbi:MAG: hypothetical protein HY319_05545 [Armatimonadetes bacterium]|nr:hypothetical protein [Armatimonadota bacterium]